MNDNDDDRDVSELLTATDRDAERWRIEAYATRQRSKVEGAESYSRFGLEARRHGDWFAIAAKLADIHAQYEAHPGSHASHLYRRALMILWPLLLDPAEFRMRPKRSRLVRSDREKMEYPLFALAVLSMKQMHDGNPVRSTPRLMIRHRSRSEKTPEGQVLRQGTRREQEDDVIGRAVLLEYVRTAPRNRDAALTAVAALGEIDGIPTGGFENVRLRYRRFRKLALERGYADSRAFWCECELKPWPNDQVWLDDFPITD